MDLQTFPQWGHLHLLPFLPGLWRLDLLRFAASGRRLRNWGNFGALDEFWERIGFLGGGFKYFLFSSLPGEMIQFD